MHFTDSELRAIAGRAEPILSRIQNGHYTSEITDEATKIDRQLKEIYEENANLSYKKRVQLQLPDDRELVEYLSLQQLDDDEPLPEWAHVIRELISEFESRYTAQQRLPESITSIPFGTLLYPVAHFLADRSQLNELLSSNLFGDEVRRQIETAFIRRVSWFMSQPLHLEFRLFKKDQTPEGFVPEQDSTALFEQFRTSQVESHFKETLVRYPVTARYLGLTIVHWSSMLSQFLSRVEQDVAEICTEFGIPPNQSISDILISQGDYHNREQTVSQIKFESGESIYYKPKNLEPECVLNRLCEVISNQSGFEYDLPEVEVVSKDGYGYVKELTAESLSGSGMDCEDALKRYYRRVGYLLCLVYVTNTTDLHYENILAIEDRPCVIDCETIFMQNITTQHIRPGCSQQEIMATKIISSVLRTGLLPFVLAEQPEKSYGRSGIAQTEPFETEAKTVQWQHTNTDAMEYQAGYAQVQPETNAPRVDGNLISPADYIKDIIDGFDVVYDYFASLETPVETLFPDININQIKSRYLFRDTARYSAVLQSLIAPNRSHNAAQTFLVTELLLKDTDKLSIDGVETLLPVLLSEQKAINQLNIPKFEIYDTDLTFEDRVLLADVFKSNDQLLRENISILSEDDKVNQIELIRGTLKASS